MTSSCASQEKLPISVVILTKNEEDTVEGAIASAKADFEEVIVLDSYSTDQTSERVKSAGAVFVQNTFEGYASQRNFALKTMRHRCKWVFFLDADERISSELIAELRENFAEKAASVGMFYLRRKDMFGGRWIRRSSGYPTWFGRLCHADFVHVEREINEEYHCSRPTDRLEEHLLHYPFAKGLSHWLERHNRYSSAEATTKATPNNNSASDPLRRLIFSKDPGLRRKGLKQIYMSLPIRPFFGFLYLYILRGGFLDGLPGLRFALLRAFYELMISIKLDEIRSNTIPTATKTAKTKLS
ncbi:glycosyltransferase family 2 protein [Pseudovibrio sp. SCP19]|uniref:glycosyltransferase family 2 protein n=1 Tax=Pseudovibrio sp. SCP19 TaxID=3141374 RepID=UPI00333C4E5B